MLLQLLLSCAVWPVAAADANTKTVLGSIVGGAAMIGAVYFLLGKSSRRVDTSEAPPGAKPYPPGPPRHPIYGHIPVIGMIDGVPYGKQMVAEYGGFWELDLANSVPGKLLRPGAKAFFVADPDLLAEMYARPGDFQKLKFKSNPVRALAGDGLFTADDDEEVWGVAHRILRGAFSQKGMKLYFDIILDCCEELFKKLEEFSAKGEPIDLHHWMSCFTFEVIGRVGFGMRFGALSGSCEFLDIMQEMTELLDENKAKGKSFLDNPVKGLVGSMFSGLGSAIEANREKIRQFVQKVVAEKKSRLERMGPAGANLDLAELMLLNEDSETGQKLPEANIRCQIVTFLIAGHDSTSSAITMLLKHVAENPEVELKIAQEVFGTLGPDKAITWEKLWKLEYCAQVIKENLRMFGPAAVIEKDVGDQGQWLKDYWIPPGSSLFINIWGVHYNPKAWPTPGKFDPERHSIEGSKDRPAYSWIPFSSGNRACIGQQLSLIEQRVVLATMTRKYHARLATSTDYVLTQPLFLNPAGIFLDLYPRTTNPMSALPAAEEEEEEETKEEVSAMAPNGKSVTVLFGSNMGAAEDFAHTICDKLKSWGYDTDMGTLDALAKGKMTPPLGNGALVVVSATYNGHAPDNAKAFEDWIQTDLTGKYKGLPYCVFGCGNKNWSATYHKFSKLIYSGLEKTGAAPLLPFACGDADGEMEAPFNKWCSQVAEALSKKLGTPMPSTNVPEKAFVEYNVAILDGKVPHVAENDILMSKTTDFMSKNKIFLGPVAVQKPLQAADSDRSTTHLELELPEGQKYTAGDHLGVWGRNPESVVSQYLERLGLTADTVIKIEGLCAGKMRNVPLDFNRPMSAAVPLRWFFELQTPATRKQIAKLATLTQDSTDRCKLEQLAAMPEDGQEDVYTSYVMDKARSVLELLQEFPSINIHYGVLLGMLTMIKPRYYSISSSPKADPKRVSISVGHVTGPSPTGRQHYGVCSTYINKEQAKNHAVIIKDTGSSFRLPKDIKKPVIMVGPGTGLAPMRGFLQDRAATPGCGPNVLFFGCRSDDDYIYKDELEGYAKSGVLAHLFVAFSRKSGFPKTYVQDMIRQNADVISDLLAKGAYIYICGDARRMAPDVKKAFAEVLQKRSGGTLEAAMGKIGDMVASHQYCEDVWASSAKF